LLSTKLLYYSNHLHDTQLRDTNIRII